MFDEQIRKILEFINNEIKFLRRDKPDVNLVSVLRSLIFLRLSK
jgi:hypothetical protein